MEFKVGDIVRCVKGYEFEPWPPKEIFHVPRTGHIYKVSMIFNDDLIRITTLSRDVPFVHEKDRFELFEGDLETVNLLYKE